MRHPGAGLAIPTWPRASADGGWLPAFHERVIAINFGHTRIGALLVTIAILALALQVWRRAPGEQLLTRPATLLVGLVAIQFGLGVLVIWHGKPPMLTSVHVVNGAAVLATTLLLALRASHLQEGGRQHVAEREWQEVHA
jgi:cytochrome c oxidase assembly protein subunit 15